MRARRPASRSLRKPPAVKKHCLVWTRASRPMFLSPRRTPLSFPVPGRLGPNPPCQGGVASFPQTEFRCILWDRLPGRRTSVSAAGSPSSRIGRWLSRDRGVLCGLPGMVRIGFSAGKFALPRRMRLRKGKEARSRFSTNPQVTAARPGAVRSHAMPVATCVPCRRGDWCKPPPSTWRIRAHMR